MKRSKRNNKTTTSKLVFCGAMAAVICIVSLVKIPFLGSKLQLANAVCILSGIIFEPLDGAVTAGLGTLLNDILFEGNDIFQSSLSLLTKFVMTYIAGKIAHSNCCKSSRIRNYFAAITSSICYVILHIGKHILLQHFILGNPWELTVIIVLSKIPTTCLNGIFAIILAPILVKATLPVLNKITLLSKES